MPAIKDTDVETFAQALAYGFTPSAAAEQASMGISDVEASHLSSRSDVQARITELLTNQQFNMELEHLRIARQLEIDRDFAYRIGHPAAAINATVQRAKLLGLMVERVATDNRVAVSSPDKLTPEEWSAKFGGAKAVPLRPADDEEDN